MGREQCRRGLRDAEVHLEYTEVRWQSRRLIAQFVLTELDYISARVELIAAEQAAMH